MNYRITQIYLIFIIALATQWGEDFVISPHHWCNGEFLSSCKTGRPFCFLNNWWECTCVYIHESNKQFILGIWRFLRVSFHSFELLLTICLKLTHTVLHRQIRSGRKPDGVCLVVGSCARGFKNNSDSDVIYSSSSVKKVGASVAQFFWEVTWFVFLSNFERRLSFSESSFPKHFTGISSWFRPYRSYDLYVHLCWSSTPVSKTGRIIRRILETDAWISG